jgi:DNA gyrase/topoisomerase IV subunit A
VPDEGEIAIEDLIANEGVIITLTHSGLIKRTNVSSYRAQRRGGKGVIGMTTRESTTGEAEASRFHRASLHRQHPRLPDVLHQHRPRLRGARPRNPRHGARLQGTQHRQSPGTQTRRKIAALIRVVSRIDAEKGCDLGTAGLPLLRHRKAPSKKPR